jgi:dTDP-glucose 4,6-dehydratase
LIINLSGRNVEIELDQKRLRPEKSEFSRLLSNNTKAREQLGWQPDISLEDGIQRTMTWISEHLELYSPDVYAF